jgi:hypothetical protein
MTTYFQNKHKTEKESTKEKIFRLQTRGENRDQKTINTSPMAAQLRNRMYSLSASKI